MVAAHGLHTVLRECGIQRKRAITAVRQALRLHTCSCTPNRCCMRTISCLLSLAVALTWAKHLLRQHGHTTPATCLQLLRACAVAVCVRMLTNYFLLSSLSCCCANLDIQLLQVLQLLRACFLCCRANINIACYCNSVCLQLLRACAVAARAGPVLLLLQRDSHK